MLMGLVLFVVPSSSELLQLVSVVICGTPPCVPVLSVWLRMVRFISMSLANRLLILPELLFAILLLLVFVASTVDANFSVLDGVDDGVAIPVLGESG